MNKMETTMQKEVNVKGILILFLTVFLSTCIYAQKKISGTFLVDFELKDFGKSFSFDNNGIFNTESSGHLGVESYGKGHYFIKKDSLLLKYDLTKLEENSCHKYKLYKNLKDSIQIQINVYNFKRKPISNINVSNLKGRYGVVSDKKGSAMLKFKKQKGKKRIDVSSLCCGNYSFYINTNFNYEIEVFIKERFDNPIAYKGDEFKYKILALTKDSIKLKTKNSFLLLKRK